MLEVELVRHEQHRHAFRALDARDQLLHRLDVLEGLVIRQAVDDDEALAVLDVEVAHRRELLGAGGVEDLEHARRIVHLDLLAVEVLDRRIVLLHEAAGHELHGERALAHPARAEDHHLELAHLVVVVGSSAPPSASPPLPRRVQDRAGVWSAVSPKRERERERETEAETR
ncbi:hypothetical protein X777_16631 [Ooceraea biroi]|uniref:Uncharacterized protein n=1 Tax=Ooceraea biroi TaxID=2015173 RepID=A0A026VUK2_OOCBI|nr:hypothetical protein X777_16631 [Ooceraea biroi]